MKRCECGCGTEIDPRRRFVSGHNSKIWLVRKPRASFTCSNCGTIVETMPSKARNRSFCSSACRDKYRRGRVGAMNPHYQGVPLVPCGWCNKMHRRRFYNSKMRANYCSPECGAAAKSKRLSEVRLSQGGTSMSHYRNKVRIRDSGRCRICRFALATHVHHIVPKSKGGKHAMDNLITLCPNHHAMAHAGELTADQLFAALK
jgi:hypothetical protein